MHTYRAKQLFSVGRHGGKKFRERDLKTKDIVIVIMYLHPITCYIVEIMYLLNSGCINILQQTKEHVEKKLVVLKAVRAGRNANSKQTNDRNNRAVHIE